MNKKVYFLSDAHLGSKSHANPKDTERKLCRFLDMAKKDAQSIYLVGDIFDYWFEYKNVVPRGFTRILGKISEITDSGIEVHFFIGNHDIWLTDYLQDECGMTIHREPSIVTINNKVLFIAHGDGLGDESISFKFLRKIFHSKVLRFLFAGIHPRWTVGLAHAWSAHSRESGDIVGFLGEDKEFLIKFAKEEIERSPNIDYFIFGHRHIVLNYALSNNTRVIHLGDWISHFSYAVLNEDGDIMIKEFNG